MTGEATADHPRPPWIVFSDVDKLENDKPNTLAQGITRNG
jgi:hypothetical protein